MNWKFWTWARQIRALKRAVALLNEDKAHLVAAVEKLQESARRTHATFDQEIDRRLEAEAKVSDLQRAMRGAHRNHHA